MKHSKKQLVSHQLLFYFFLKTKKPTFFLKLVEVCSKNKFTKDSVVGSIKMPRLSLDLDNVLHEGWFPIIPYSKGFFSFFFLIEMKEINF